MGRQGKSDHHQTIQEEFSRQAETLGRAAVFTDQEVMDRIRSAVVISRDMRLLDVGCGPGLVTAALAPYVKEIVALDLTPEMIAQARKRCDEAGLTNVRFETGPAEKLPFERNSFDGVVTRYTFHHFTEPSIVLSEMARVTKPKGRIVIVEILSSETPEEAELHNALEILRDPSHTLAWPRSRWQQLIESRQLRILKEERWTKPREFEEWIQITNAPSRLKPLSTVMARLAKAGVKGGVDLRLEGTKVLFNHSYMLLALEKP